MKYHCVAISATVLCVVGVRCWRSGDIRRSLSSLAQACSREPAIAADVARNAFAQTVLLPPKPIGGHTHATAAAVRSSATNFARLMAASIGGRLYSLSMSKSDQRHGIAGERQWFWAKDVHAVNQRSPPRPNDLHYMCDVDYYKDLPYFLAENVKPLLLYTFVPEDAASSGRDNSSFYFDASGRLNMLVSGGGSYCHFLWDYGMDSLIAVKKVFGIPVRSTVYAVERKQVGYSRQLILLTPVRVFEHLGAVLSTFLLDSRPLGRFIPLVQVGTETYVRFRIQTANGAQVTTGKAGSLLCATIDAKTDEAISLVSGLCVTKLQLPTVVGWVGKERRPEAALLTEYFRNHRGRTSLTVFPVEYAVRSYAYEPDQYDQDTRPKLEAFMSPLVHGAFCPVPDAAAERACVEGRINKLKGPEPKPNNFVFQCMEEFAELIVGGAVLAPVELDTVIAKQTRPAQKLSLAKAMVAGPYSMLVGVLKCFIKSEAYADVKDPRNISQYNDADKLEMAQFALALSEHMKQFKWYGPGKTPLEIAKRMVEICDNAKRFANISDLHRMDGTIKYVLRLLDRIVSMKAFRDHGAELNELLQRNAGNIGILPNGTSFEQGPTHGSGCSATSLYQTNRAAFLAYLAYRHTPDERGRYPTPEEAFDKLGLHFGDDGIDADLPISSHEWAAGKLGLQLEAEVVHRGEPGITFLARTYSSNVWYGSPDSMCDVRRQLSKFHTCVRLPANVPPEDKLVEKARGYVATDANTPVLGQLCRRAVALSSAEQRRRQLGLGHWWAQFDESVQFPNSNADGWMDAEFSRVFPEFDRDQFNEWLRSTGSLSQLLGAPLCCETKPATPTVSEVVVDGDVLPAKSTSSRPGPTSCSPDETQEKASRTSGGKDRRRNRKSGKDRGPAKTKSAQPMR